MSKSTYSTKHHHDRYSPPPYSNRSSYVSPLEKLDRLAQKFQSKKVLENNNYKKLYYEGKCNLFETSNYRYYHIHHQTPMDILDDLIDYAKEVTNYTIDTEDQLQPPPQPSKPALLQIEYVYENNPSILLIIEMMYLPKQHEPAFIKIKQLLKIIFSNNHTIYLWGGIHKELKHFYRFGLFDENDINSVKERNIQDEFKCYLNQTYPLSPDIKLKTNETYSLQFAIYKMFNQWLNKRFTLANFGCGLDPALDTIIIPRQFSNQQKRIIEDEEEIRKFMINYALNDCLAVTKLVYELPLSIESKSPTQSITNDLEAISEDELPLDYEQEHMKPSTDTLNGVHARDEPYEMISDDEFDGISLPEIMKLHLPHQQQLYNGKPLDYDDTLIGVHAQNEPPNEIEIISDDDIEQNRPVNQHKHQQHQPLTRNQTKN
ncbi:unnamed protein product [Rotaria magnacalcarata]|uniref:Uncharacterized protein n=3 Tax=Rotaria magnacalcarata TaxID=392030 RepID=A0A816WMF2_9BILA|nr:unnamed protein product [Rotaria magnacalcarata]CAF4172512.1 unnamed protein product [Rotaria magnacalcarata]